MVHLQWLEPETNRTSSSLFLFHPLPVFEGKTVRSEKMIFLPLKVEVITVGFPPRFLLGTVLR